MKRRRRGKASYDDGLSPPERVCSLLREIQWETNCSTLTLQKILDTLRGKLGETIEQCKTDGYEIPRSAKAADKKMETTVGCFTLKSTGH